MITGTVVNGAVVLDAGTRLPEGARVNLELIEEFPPDHPMAPYDRQTELAILRESIESVKSGEVCIPLREGFETLSRKHGLGPLLPE